MKKPREEEEDDDGVSAREALIVAAVILLVVRELVPFGQLILYPFTLMATWVHEMGHGVTGLLVGGSFDKLEVFADASGLAYGSTPDGWPQALRSAGGLLGPPIAGAAILALARGPRRSLIVLSVFAGVMALSVPVWVRSLTGWIAIPIVAALVGLLAYKGGPGMRTIGAQFLGILLGLDTLGGLDYLFVGTATVDGEERPSDVANIADSIGGHYLLWGVLLAIVSLVLLYVGVRIAWAKPVKLRLPWRRKASP